MATTTSELTTTPNVAGTPDAVVIRPPTKWGSFGLAELWEFRELLYFLIRRDILVRYKQSVLGIFWAVAQPLALALIFWIFFGQLAGVKSGNGLPYPVFAFAALVPWMFVSQGVSQAAQSLTGDANLLAKVYFPRLALPFAKIGALCVDLVIALIVLLILMLGFGIGIVPQVVALPLFLLIGLLTALGAGTFFAAANVKYRDITVAVPLAVQVWLFATPVVYPGTLVEGNLQYVYALNPMVSVVTGTRWALLDAAAPNWGAVAVSAVVALIGVATALVYFRRTQHYFADIV
ncbi:MAG: lipopolysaccharide transport system permease protein [Thermoleophilaceae bacterium]|jgi:lipopolysaccharide transport system permease protein|nr:lipopolysaccharide transport system permease protein [Thermoleophilaceae bacterium]